MKDSLPPSGYNHMVVALDGGVGGCQTLILRRYALSLGNNVLLTVHTHMPCPDTGVKAYAPWVQFVQ